MDSFGITKDYQISDVIKPTFWRTNPAKPRYYRGSLTEAQREKWPLHEKVLNIRNIGAGKMDIVIELPRKSVRVSFGEQ